MIRVLYVSTSTTLGGAEKTLYTLATRLDPERFKTAGIVSVKPKGDYAARLETAGYAVYSLGADRFPGPGSVRRLAEIIRDVRPDIVHAFLYQAIQISRAAKRWYGGNFKLISSPRVHYRSRSFPTLWVDRLLKRFDDLLISESTSSRDYLRRQLHYEDSRTFAIHNGIEEAPEPAPEDRLRVRKELGVGPDEILLGAVGRLELQKGHAYLLEAVAKLRVLHPVRCVIIGDGSLGPELAGLAQSLHIGPYVRFAGQKRDLSPWYAAMDIFVLPSLWEGFPNSILEAMAAGLPVVATNIDGVPEAVEDGRNGLLCDARNSQALFSGVQQLILHPELRSGLGEAGRRTVLERFRLGAMLDAYQAAYERVIAS